MTVQERLRKTAWRLGRKLYLWARKDLINDPDTNGEYWLLKELIQTRHEGQVFLDVGANKGDWSAHALALSQQKSMRIKIHCFEPTSVTRALLTSRYAAVDNITVHATALSSERGQEKFYSGSDYAGTNSLSPISGQRVELVEVSTIDHFMQALEIKKIAMCKIDTEGYDFQVLLGAQQALLSGAIEIIQFEYNWRWLINHACLRDVFSLIKNSPYRFGKLVGTRIEFYEAWHFELDRFFENNYVLIRTDSTVCDLGDLVYFDAANSL